MSTYCFPRPLTLQVGICISTLIGIILPFTVFNVYCAHHLVNHASSQNDASTHIKFMLLFYIWLSESKSECMQESNIGEIYHAVLQSSIFFASHQLPRQSKRRCHTYCSADSHNSGWLTHNICYSIELIGERTLQTPGVCKSLPPTIVIIWRARFLISYYI